MCTQLLCGIILKVETINERIIENVNIHIYYEKEDFTGLILIFLALHIDPESLVLYRSRIS